MKNEAEYISRKYLNHDDKSPYLEESLLGLSLNEAERILSSWHSFENLNICINTIKQYSLEHFFIMTKSSISNKNGSAN